MSFMESQFREIVRQKIVDALAAAAAYERLDLTSFILRNVLPAAREVVGRAERIVLSERDTEKVLKLLDNPPKPTRTLVAAARRRLGRK